MKFIVNYIKICTAYTFILIQHQFKTGVPQGGILSPTLFNIYTVDLTQPRAPVQVMAYADDITITSSHTSMIAPRNTYNWTKHNNLTLNQDKTACTLFIPDPAEYKNNLDLKINNTALPMATHPKILGFTVDPKLTYSTHIHNISVHTHKPQQIIKLFIVTV